jgi:hypothetical protein
MGQRLDLHEILKGIAGVAEAYFQPPNGTDMVYPCITYQRDDSYTEFANNKLYFGKKRYSVTVIDRDPDSTIPDAVEALPYTRFDRFFVVDGLNHTAFQTFF